MKQIQGDGFTVTIKRSSRRKTTALTIRRGHVFIHIPKRLPICIAQQFVTEKTEWIKQKLEQQLLTQAVERKFESGEKLFFLGETYSLKLIEKVTPLSVSINNQDIDVVGRKNKLTKAAIHAAIIFWYKQQAEVHLRHQTHQLAIKTGLTPKSITIKTYKARWGSCGISGDIQFNWKLILAPLDIINYVITHELCHIEQHNHSAAFWQLVEHHCPDFKSARLWLKKKGHTLDV